MFIMHGARFKKNKKRPNPLVLKQHEKNINKALIMPAEISI